MNIKIKTMIFMKYEAFDENPFFSSLFDEKSESIDSGGTDNTISEDDEFALILKKTNKKKRGRKKIPC